MSVSSYKSPSELYFSWWLDDLKVKQYIKEYTYEPEAISIGSNVEVPIKVKTKNNKLKKKTKVIRLSVTYTPDFKIIWTEKSLGVFLFSANQECQLEKVPYFYIPDSDNLNMFVEVKPDSYDFQNMTRNVGTTLKLIYSNTQLYIPCVKPLQLFQATFYPKRYLYTDSGEKPRRKGGNVLQVITIDQFLENENIA